METDREIASGVACGEPMELDRAIEFGDPGALPNGDFGDPGGPLTVARIVPPGDLGDFGDLGVVGDSGSVLGVSGGSGRRVSTRSRNGSSDV